jgi:hypothetical protein
MGWTDAQPTWRRTAMGEDLVGQGRRVCPMGEGQVKRGTKREKEKAEV